MKAGSPGSRPFDYFKLFANEEFFKLLETETNINGINLFQTKNCENVSRDEMENFLGMLFHMGNIKLNKLQDYWRKDGLYDQPTFSKVMPWDRFLFILRSIHFGRNAREGEPKSIDPFTVERKALFSTVYSKQKTQIWHQIVNLGQEAGGVSHTQKVVKKFWKIM
ncbi:hypothetical protein J437_LFUL006404 [Ladona fulva]|uniref:PiggyBac transposable element-derived protein domain-containing protein n=1 Tax=Ladona fulva TaxID=123851 RepID=A0A8K0K0L9_LADFU|nr:hypothetical protein J437_LFUL006404 [Ladona fulva]